MTSPTTELYRLSPITTHPTSTSMPLQNSHLTYLDEHVDLSHIHLTEADIPGEICVDEYYLETPSQFSRSRYVWMLVRDPVNVLWMIILVQSVAIGMLLWYIEKNRQG